MVLGMRNIAMVIALSPQLWLEYIREYFLCCGESTCFSKWLLEFVFFRIREKKEGGGGEELCFIVDFKVCTRSIGPTYLWWAPLHSSYLKHNLDSSCSRTQVMAQYVNSHISMAAISMSSTFDVGGAKKLGLRHCSGRRGLGTVSLSVPWSIMGGQRGHMSYWLRSC